MEVPNSVLMEDETTAFGFSMLSVNMVAGALFLRKERKGKERYFIS